MLGIVLFDVPFNGNVLAVALGAAVLYAVGVLLQKQALRDVDPFSATWLGCVAGAVACLPFAPALIDEVGRAPAAAIAHTARSAVRFSLSRSRRSRPRTAYCVKIRSQNLPMRPGSSDSSRMKTRAPVPAGCMSHRSIPPRP